MLLGKEERKQDERNFESEILSGNLREIPESMKTNEAVAYNQNNLAVERTEFAKIRTDLAITNSQLAVDRTHLAYLRTIVSLIGSGATLYKALPLLGVNGTFTVGISGFLLLAAGYFIYKDASTYPRMKRQLQDMIERASELAEQTENKVYRLDNEDDL